MTPWTIITYDPTTIMEAIKVPNEATCTCGCTYYTDQGNYKFEHGQCPACVTPKPPFLLRDQCGGCGNPCSADWCPYCEGHSDGEEVAESTRRALVFSTQQQEMLAGQMAARDRVIAELQEGAYELNREILRLKQAAIVNQGDVARFRKLFEGASVSAATLQGQVMRMQDDAARLRKGAAWTLAAIVGAAAAGALGWACWDRLPGWSFQAWCTVVVALAALLLGRRWPRRWPRHKPEFWTMDVTWKHIPTMSPQELPGGNPGSRPTAESTPSNTSTP